MDGRTPAPAPGFEQLWIDQEFALRVDFELPDEPWLAKLDGRRLRKPYELAVRQYYNDEPIGGNGIRVKLNR